LQEKLKDKDEVEHTRTKDMTASKGLTAGGTEFHNPAALLRRRLDKW